MRHMNESVVRVLGFFMRGGQNIEWQFVKNRKKITLAKF